MGRTARTAQVGRAEAQTAAVAKARTRRAALDADRKARDARIDAAVVDHYLALDQRAEGQRLIVQADAADAAVIMRILDEGLSVGQVADLTELSEQTVKRLKALPAKPDPVTGELPVALRSPAVPDQVTDGA